MDKLNPVITLILSLAGVGATYLGLLLTRRGQRESDAVDLMKTILADARKEAADAEAARERSEQAVDLARREARDELRQQWAKHGAEMAELRSQVDQVRRRADRCEERCSRMEAALRYHGLPVPPRDTD